MEKRSTTEKVGKAVNRSASPAIGCEMPETPELILPEGKISTATRKRLLPFVKHEAVQKEEAV